MFQNTTRYTPIVEKDSFDDSSEETVPRCSPVRSWWSDHGRVYCLAGLVILLLATNGVQLIRERRFKSNDDIDYTHYSKLQFDTPVTYHAHTEYWGDNETLADELWESLNADPVAVALSKDYQKEYNLPPSSPFPWDDNKDLYYVKAFHDLHCLKVLRHAFINYRRGTFQDVSDGHIDHCLDAIRQDIMCKADDTPMPITKVRHSVGNGQQMECRNWDKLVAWTQDIERNACFRIMDDYHPIVHSLERHQFCPKESPYYPVMTGYFEKFGHRDPFSDKELPPKTPW